MSRRCHPPSGTSILADSLMSGEQAPRDRGRRRGLSQRLGTLQAQWGALCIGLVFHTASPPGLPTREDTSLSSRPSGARVSACPPVRSSPTRQPSWGSAKCGGTGPSEVPARPGGPAGALPGWSLPTRSSLTSVPPWGRGLRAAGGQQGSRPQVPSAGSTSLRGTTSVSRHHRTPLRCPQPQGRPGGRPHRPRFSDENVGA